MGEQSARTGLRLHDSGQHPACSVCGAAPTIVTDARTVRSDLVQVPASATSNRFRMVCADCLGRALPRVGPGRGPDALRTLNCSGEHAKTDDTRYAVVAQWPNRSHAPPPYWLACAPHLNDALDALTLEGTPHASAVQ